MRDSETILPDFTDIFLHENYSEATPDQDSFENRSAISSVTFESEQLRELLKVAQHTKPSSHTVGAGSECDDAKILLNKVY